VLVRFEQVGALIGALCTGIALVCAYALATRLFPNGFVSATGFGANRLARPVGYWNGLGLIAGIGAILALGLAARAATAIGRAAAGAGAPALVMTLYFTFSRGAWLSMLVALCLLVVVDRRRLQLLATAMPLFVISGLIIWRASRVSALTHIDVSLASATHAGHSLAATLAIAMFASACVVVLALKIERAGAVPRVVRNAARSVLVALLVAAVAIALAHFGAPWTIARHGYSSFKGRPPATSGNLNGRLFTLSNNNRLEAWRVAVHAFESHPVIGVGAGGYEQYWDAHRPIALTIRDAHSLYLETMAETGIVGLVVLIAALSAPLLAFRRARKAPLASFALAAYVAFLIEAAVDWDWELSGVTLAGLLCGGALLVAGRGEERQVRRWRWAMLGLGSAIAVFSLGGLVGNISLASSTNAARAGNWSAAASDARRARLFAPWSAQPWQMLGEAELGLGRTTKAIASFRAAVRKDPGSWDLWVELGLASRGSEQASAFARAQSLNPLDPTIAETREELAKP
jgi:hypothetical protein